MNISVYSNMYKEIFPNEVPPSVEFCQHLKEVSDFYLEGKYNLIYVQIKEDGRYEIIAHWCIANPMYPRKENFLAFREFYRFKKSLGNVKLFISGLNSSYNKVSTTSDFKDKRIL